MKKQALLSAVSVMKRFNRLLVALLAVAFAGSANATIIGIWDIKAAPVSASALSGAPSGSYNQWLNVVDMPIGVDEALSGENILDDGIANMTTDALFELSFAPGSALNITGTDLVLFDARYDAGVYAVSTSFDEFATEITLPVDAFIDTGESRDYYFGGMSGIYPANIYGAAIDLSMLGVTDGVAVSSIRIRSLYSEGADFIGVGSLYVPVPAAVWLFGSGLLGLIGVARRKARV